MTSFRRVLFRPLVFVDLLLLCSLAFSYFALYNKNPSQAYTGLVVSSTSVGSTFFVMVPYVIALLAGSVLLGRYVSRHRTLKTLKVYLVTSYMITLIPADFIIAVIANGVKMLEFILVGPLYLLPAVLLINYLISKPSSIYSNDLLGFAYPEFFFGVFNGLFIALLFPYLLFPVLLLAILVVYDIYAVFFGSLKKFVQVVSFSPFAAFFNRIEGVRTILDYTTVNLGITRLGIGDILFYPVMVGASYRYLLSVPDTLVVILAMNAGMILTFLILHTGKLKALPALPLPITFGLISMFVLGLIR